MTAATYRAAIYQGVENVEVVDLPYPECGDDDVIVRNIMAGVCGTDIHAYRHGGDDYRILPGLEFGHEAISEVVEIGRNVTGLKLGDRVFPNQGKALRDPGRASTMGAFSEYIRIPQCEVGYSVLPIDNDLPAEVAVLFEPFVIGLRAAKSLSPAPGMTAIVFGGGIIGLACAIMLEWLGCTKVMVVERSTYRLENARRMGLLTCNPETETLDARAFAEFGSSQTFFGERCGADLYVDAIGLKVAIENFARLAGQEAALAVVGVHHEPVALDYMQLCFGNWKISGSGNLPIEDAVPEIVAMMRSGRYDLASLVSHAFPVEQIADALAMGANADQSQKVCISFNKA